MFDSVGRYDDAQEEDYDRPVGLGAASVPPSAPVNVNMTGDEAYQRRLAMSRGFQPAAQVADPTPTPSTSLQELADKQDHSFKHDAEGSFEIPTSPRAVPRMDETGEEAYLRRLALSQGRQQLSAVPTSPIPPPVLTAESEPSSDPENPFATTPTIPPPPPIVAPGISEDRVKSSREAAAAIAARLAALAPPPGTSTESPEEGSSTAPIQDDGASGKR